MPRIPSRSGGTLATIFRRFADENMPQTAAALAFTTLLALVPMLTLIVSVADAIPYLDLLIARLDAILVKELLPQGSTANTISNYLTRFTGKARSLTVPGLAVLAITTFLLLQTIERAFNHLWQVAPRPLLQRIRLYAIVIILWPFLLGAIAAAASFIISTSLGFINEPSWVRAGIFKVLSALLLGLFFAFIYYTLPNAKVEKRAAFSGGAFVALLFGLMQKGFELFLASSSFKSIYGAFAAAPIFLIWLHLCWTVVLSGGLIAATVFRHSRR